MTYQRLHIEPHDPPSARKIKQAVEILHGGGVVAYPTDTVYALGCALEARKATERIFRAKEMQKSQRLALICPDLSTASQYGHFNQAAYRLAQRVLPGPYTLVLRATREVPKLLVERKRRTVGIRIPAHPVAVAMARELGRPLLTTSAIAPGSEDACSDADELAEAFGRHIDLLVDCGPTRAEPSTVLEVVENEVTVLRRGLGPIDDILI